MDNYPKGRLSIFSDVWLFFFTLIISTFAALITISFIMKTSRVIKLLLLLLTFIGVSFPVKAGDSSSVYDKQALLFARSEMVRFPEAWQLDYGKRLFWGYAQGVGCCAMLDMWKATGDNTYYNDGTLTLTRCCQVGGLGGNPYRDGSFEYYVGEKMRDNDATATGPYIMGCLQLGQ